MYCLYTISASTDGLATAAVLAEIGQWSNCKEWHAGQQLRFSDRFKEAGQRVATCVEYFACCTVRKHCVDHRLGRLHRRGPDGYIRMNANEASTLTDGICAQVHGCILHLRGDDPVKQPLQSTCGTAASFFLWNGEVFDGVNVAIGANDTEVIFQALEKCATDDPSSVGLLSLMSKVHGPWAFVYWQATSKRLWFGRDMFGRRSLLWTRSCDIGDSKCVFALSSVIDRPTLTAKNLTDATQVWDEVPACGIFCLDLSLPDVEKNYFAAMQCFTWNTVPDSDRRLRCDYVSQKIDADLKIIYDRIEKSMPATVIFEELLKVDAFRVRVKELKELLSSAVKRRVMAEMSSSFCKNCTLGDHKAKKICVHAKMAVLFSGGLDSTVLCALADRFVSVDEPIDLLNVAFEIPNVTESFDVPDRISGRNALKELKQIAPSRQWNFVEVNISKHEMETERKVDFQKCTAESQIADLVYPLTTVLDNDLGCAVWFAARGKGRLLVNGQYEDYTSPAKVVLTGIGADEQLGGYSRHRVCYERGSWQALITEIEMEMGRISQRNLGRDDRVIADHGREGRFPFLDEHVVTYLNGLPIWFKVNLDLPRGVGDKVLLRTLAFHLGLEFTASLEKRALQFGSRITKMVKSRNGNNTCSRLLAKVK